LDTRVWTENCGGLARGDVPMAIALAAEATIEVVDPVDCCGEPLADELLAELDRDIEQLAKSLGLLKSARVERSP